MSNHHKIHSEIEYVREDGLNVHSDLCPPKCEKEGLNNDEYRAYLHAALDEWLKKSGGTGYFYIASDKFCMTTLDNIKEA